MAAKVAIIIINLNQEKDTRECLNSLLNLSYRPVEIILIDNGSVDGSGRRLHTEYPSVVFRRLEENIGFSRGNNAGIRIALERGADHIVILNNDTVVDPDFIQPLLELGRSDPGIGAQSCKIYFFSDPKKLWYAGGILYVDKALGFHRGMHQVDSGRFDTIEETDFATGCMMFFSREAIEKVGLLDCSLFAYFEDSDWCVRARQHGYRVMYNPKAQIWHKVSVTSKIDSSTYLYFTMRNKLLFLRKHSSPRRWLKYLPYLVYFYSRQILRVSLKLRSLQGTRAVILGLADGIRNYTGQNGKGHFERLLQRGR